MKCNAAFLPQVPLCTRYRTDCELGKSRRGLQGWQSGRREIGGAEHGAPGRRGTGDQHREVQARHPSGGCAGTDDDEARVNAIGDEDAGMRAAGVGFDGDGRDGASQDVVDARAHHIAGLVLERLREQVHPGLMRKEHPDAERLGQDVADDQACPPAKGFGMGLPQGLIGGLREINREQTGCCVVVLPPVDS